MLHSCSSKSFSQPQPYCMNDLKVVRKRWRWDRSQQPVAVLACLGKDDHGVKFHWETGSLAGESVPNRPLQKPGGVEELFPCKCKAKGVTMCPWPKGNPHPFRNRIWNIRQHDFKRGLGLNSCLCSVGPPQESHLRGRLQMESSQENWAHRRIALSEEKAWTSPCQTLDSQSQGRICAPKRKTPLDPKWAVQCAASWEQGLAQSSCRESTGAF